MSNLSNLVASYGREVRDNLKGPGQQEALITRPVANFIQGFGTRVLQRKTVAHDQVSELAGAVRPDFGVRVDELLVGHVELKAPGVSLDPETYSSSSHNGKQWARLANLPNLLHTNGLEWRLWRYGELALPPVYVHAKDLKNFRGDLEAPESLSALLAAFLSWEPSPIRNVIQLTTTLAPLATMLREEVLAAVRGERKEKRGDPSLQPASLPFTGLASDWRSMLYPRATDSEFADGFAQTVVFALVVALSEGVELSTTSLTDVAKKLQPHHGLLGRSLALLTNYIDSTPTAMAIEIINRTLSAVNWGEVSRGRSDVYLHLYEHFLDAYDPEKRRESGSYYTPVEVVDSMVRLTDDAVIAHFAEPAGLGSSAVSIIDPAMGTGTYPLSILRHVGAGARSRGSGAVSDAISDAVSRIYGIEIQSGPFSVAELRLTQAIKDMGGAVPSSGLNIYVADTLEDPEVTENRSLSYALQLIAAQRREANEVKLKLPIQVCIGNPPYRERSLSLGGWITEGTDSRTGRPPIDAFRQAGNGRQEFNMANLYAYFWRWATWKVFDSSGGGPGVVCFITATGYLAGPAFRGMREYLRRESSRGWIINVTPEGKRPPAKNAVFNIETPVAIALFVREAANDPNIPADIKYREVHGTREEKFARLSEIHLDDGEFRSVRSGWSDPFLPSENAVWDQSPALEDLLSWRVTGVSANRGWVRAPSEVVLSERWRALVVEDDIEMKKKFFKESGTSSVYKGKKPLPGAGTELATQEPIVDLIIPYAPPTERVTFRSFDRQYVISDSRLFDRARIDLWRARMSNQIFVVEQHSISPGGGPGLYFSSLLPDINAFDNRGGRVVPWLNPDGSFNLTPGLQDVISEMQGPGRVGDLIYYIAAIVGHSGYTRVFKEELRTPGVRIPITNDPVLWDEAVEVGKRIVWLHTFGERGAEGVDLVSALPQIERIEPPAYETSVGQALPAGVFYEEGTGIIRLGQGSWSQVDPRVWAYVVGGQKILQSWVSYRRANPKGKNSSPLDGIVADSWSPQWSAEFDALLVTLTSLVELEPIQDRLLSSILSNETVNLDGLVDRGLEYPLSGDRSKPLRDTHSA